MIKALLIFFFTCACICTRAQVKIIITIAGDGMASYGGDGGPASGAKLNQPEMLCLDKLGNLYIADAGNNRVRKIEVGSNVISTIAGTGAGSYSGDGGPATNAKLFIPDGIALDS